MSGKSGGEEPGEGASVVNVESSQDAEATEATEATEGGSL